MALLVEAEWEKNRVVQYNKGKYTDGCIEVTLKGPGLEGKLTFEVVTETEHIPKACIEWRVYAGGRTVQMPPREIILEAGEGYKPGETVCIGGSHTGIVDLVTASPKQGGIAALRKLKRGAYTERTDVEGGSGKDCRVRIPKDECDFVDGMRLKIHIRHSSKHKPCRVHFFVGDSDDAWSPCFYVVSKVGEEELYKKRKAVGEIKKPPSLKQSKMKKKKKKKLKRRHLVGSPPRQSASAGAAHREMGAPLSPGILGFFDDLGGIRLSNASLSSLELEQPLAAAKTKSRESLEEKMESLSMQVKQIQDTLSDVTRLLRFQQRMR